MTDDVSSILRLDPRILVLGSVGLLGALLQLSERWTALVYPTVGLGLLAGLLFLVAAIKDARTKGRKDP